MQQAPPSITNSSFSVWFATAGVAPIVWCLVFVPFWGYNDIINYSASEIGYLAIFVFISTFVGSYICTLPAFIIYILTSIFIEKEITSLRKRFYYHLIIGNLCAFFYFCFFLFLLLQEGRPISSEFFWRTALFIFYRLFSVLLTYCLFVTYFTYKYIPNPKAE